MANAAVAQFPSSEVGSGSRKRLVASTEMPSVGDVIADKYQLVRLIGEGGMGVVFEATHLRLRQRLAIKVLRPDLPDLGRVVERFEREARAAAVLHSLHTARVFDVDTLPSGLPYFVMEYLEGRDLDAELAAAGPLPVEEAVDIAIQVAEAMGEAHRVGIVHRDLKPSNLFVCRKPGAVQPVVKVLDFGISKSEGDADDGDERLTPREAYFGTPHYAAPEQLRDAAAADERSDIWSLGIVLYELLTGRTPFQGSASSVIAQVAADPIPWPLRFRPDLPRALARVLAQALRRDPSRRFHSMDAFARALAPFGSARTACVVSAGEDLADRRLGEILVDEGILRPKDLHRALATQRRSGGLLGRTLVLSGLVSHVDLLAALARQQGIASFEDEEIDDVALEEQQRNSPTVAVLAYDPAPARAPRSLAAAVIGLSIGFALTLAVACGRSVTFSDHVDGHKSQGTMGHAPALHAVR
jgi:serine/threonine-protein kinase